MEGRNQQEASGTDLETVNKEQLSVLASVERLTAKITEQLAGETALQRVSVLWQSC